MTTYALLIYRTSPPGTEIAKSERADAMAGHRSLQRESAARGELHAVAQLGEPASARTVRQALKGHDVTDGPFIESKEWLVGFYLVDCEDEAQATERARMLAQDGHHVIEVRPVAWRWRG